jgi:hypothetical protein
MNVLEQRAAVPSRAAGRERNAVPTGREIGQSIYLMALMAVMLSFYVGMGLLAVRLFG